MVDKATFVYGVTALLAVVWVFIHIAATIGKRIVESPGTRKTMIVVQVCSTIVLGSWVVLEILPRF